MLETQAADFVERPNVLLIISDDQGYGDFGFTGISIRESLKNAAATVSRPLALRLAIAGPGAAPDGPPEMPRPLGIHHVALRGERFKYHSLPGGKQTLYDLQADPGETTDVSSKHPDILARMAGECEARWREVLESGRAFAAP